MLRISDWDKLTVPAQIEDTNAFHVNCYIGESTEAPARVDILAMIDVIGGIILEDSTTNFSTYTDLILTAKDGFMGGWWTAEWD